MKLLCCALVAGGLVSCAQVASMKTAAVEKFQKLPELSAKLLPGHNRIPIVEPRPGDMRDFKTGHDHAVAFEKTRRGGGSRFFGLFRGPVDFKEPALPSDAESVDGSLLPPKVD